MQLDQTRDPHVPGPPRRVVVGRVEHEPREDGPRDAHGARDEPDAEDALAWRELDAEGRADREEDDGEVGRRVDYARGEDVGFFVDAVG